MAWDPVVLRTGVLQEFAEVAERYGRGARAQILAQTPVRSAKRGFSILCCNSDTPYLKACQKRLENLAKARKLADKSRYTGKRWVWEGSAVALQRKQWAERTRAYRAKKRGTP